MIYEVVTLVRSMNQSNKSTKRNLIFHVHVFLKLFFNLNKQFMLIKLIY